MENTEKIARLEKFRSLLAAWESHENPEDRRLINQTKAWVRREIIEAGGFKTLTVSPPPAVGGLIMRNIDPFDMIFDSPYVSMIPIISDMIDETIGILQASPEDATEKIPQIRMDADMRKGYAFIAMPIVPGDTQFDDVLDAIKEAANRCGIHAERVDEPHSNERITDRILESIRKAEYVIVDLTGSRPNVFYEAGYAQGIRKTPIYIAREGTKLEFDLKDYPVIFFSGMKELKDRLEQRLRGLAKAKEG